MKKIINKAIKLFDEQIKNFGHPSRQHHDILLKKALYLSKKFKNINKDVIILSTYLMDIRLGKCLKEKKLKNHAKEGAEISRKFLNQFDLKKEFVEKIVNCVESHHGECSFKSKEAEICANADAYPFIHPAGFFEKFYSHIKRGDNLEECFLFLDNKLDEKWNILSLSICKKELKPHYKMFKTLIKEAKKDL